MWADWGQAAVMFLRLFRTRYGRESWKKWTGRVGGGSGEGVDEKSMAWGCELLLGVIGDKLQ